MTQPHLFLNSFPGRYSMPEFDHTWYWKSRLPERKNQPCRILARGKKNSVLVEFDDWARVITSRYAVRKSDDVLKNIFKKVQYVIHAPDQEIVVKIGRESPVLDSYLQSNSFKTWAFITPQNAQAKKRSEEENSRFLKEFLKEIKGRNFLKAHTETPGALWPDEYGAWLPDISRSEALALAGKFQQKAIVYGEIFCTPQLIFC